MELLKIWIYFNLETNLPFLVFVSIELKNISFDQSLYFFLPFFGATIKNQQHICLAFCKCVIVKMFVCAKIYSVKKGKKHQIK